MARSEGVRNGSGRGWDLYRREGVTLEPGKRRGKKGCALRPHRTACRSGDPRMTIALRRVPDDAHRSDGAWVSTPKVVVQGERGGGGGCGFRVIGRRTRGGAPGIHGDGQVEGVRGGGRRVRGHAKADNLSNITGGTRRCRDAVSFRGCPYRGCRCNGGAGAGLGRTRRQVRKSGLFRVSGG